MSELTLGEKRVRTSFNPSAISIVDTIKQKVAELINICESIKTPNNVREASVAQTEFESAAHWAVKAATSGL